MQKLARRAGLLLIASVGVATLSGCSLPQEEQRRYVEQVKVALDYKSAGTVLSEDYTGSGVIGPTAINVSIKGPDAFSTLVERLQNLPTAECEVIENIQQATCDVRPVEIFLTRNVSSDQTFNLQIIDTYNGRVSK